MFYNLSTPKAGKAPASDPTVQSDLEPEVLIDVNGTLIRENPTQEDIIEGDETDKALADVINTDEVIAMSPGEFSAYDDLKQKLIAKGIPGDEIAFIHDAKTDIRKSKLLGHMNTFFLAPQPKWVWA